MKVIDLLNKIAKGEEVPKEIKYDGELCSFDIEDKDYYCEQYGNIVWYLVDTRGNMNEVLETELEILDEEDEFIDIKPLVLKTFARTGEAVTLDRFEDYSFDNFKSIEDTLAKVILNQKKIIQALKENK